MVLVGGLLWGQGSVVAPVNIPAEGGVYTEALVGAPRALNPLLDFANPVDRDLDRLIFSGLTRFDAAGRPMPDLAQWFISDDQLTYTFILRPNLQWHDGQPLTAEDVAFTIGLMQDPAYPGPADLSALWRAVKYQIGNAQTISITLPEPFAPFLDYTTFGLLPKHKLAGVAAGDLAQNNFSRNPIGSGPFKLGRWQVAGQQIIGVALEVAPANYLTRPKLNQVRFNFYPDSATAFAAYEQGAVQGLSHLEPAQLEAVLQLPNLGLYSALLPEYSLIFLNQRNPELPFLAEKKVRQALLYGLNRSAMVTNILKGQAVVADSPVVPGSWAYNTELPLAAYDPARANSLLDAAGWVFPADAVAGTATYVRQKDGKPLKFTLTTSNAATQVALANAAKETWAAIGVQVEINLVDAAALRTDYLEPRAYEALLTDFNLSGTPDPDPYPLWHETQVESGQNYSGFSDRITSELLEQARITTDPAQRARLYQRFQSRFGDQVPALLLYYPVYNYAVDTKVNGVQLGPLTEPSDRLSHIADWYIVTRRVNAPQAEGTATP